MNKPKNKEIKYTESGPKFKYKNNYYWKKGNNFLIRSSDNTCGYSWLRVTDPKMQDILNDYLKWLEV